VINNRYKVSESLSSRSLLQRKKQDNSLKMMLLISSLVLQGANSSNANGGRYHAYGSLEVTQTHWCCRTRTVEVPTYFRYDTGCPALLLCDRSGKSKRIKTMEYGKISKIGLGRLTEVSSFGDATKPGLTFKTEGDSYKIFCKDREARYWFVKKLALHIADNRSVWNEEYDKVNAAVAILEQERLDTCAFGPAKLKITRNGSQHYEQKIFFKWDIDGGKPLLRFCEHQHWLISTPEDGGMMEGIDMEVYDSVISSDAGCSITFRQKFRADRNIARLQKKYKDYKIRLPSKSDRDDFFDSMLTALRNLKNPYSEAEGNKCATWSRVKKEAFDILDANAEDFGM